MNKELTAGENYRIGVNAKRLLDLLHPFVPIDSMPTLSNMRINFNTGDCLVSINFDSWVFREPREYLKLEEFFEKNWYVENGGRQRETASFCLDLKNRRE